MFRRKPKQIKCAPKGLRLQATIVILTETKTQNIFKQIEAIQPEIVIIDPFKPFILIT
jgi:DNA repair protein RadA/Sms